MLAYLVIREGTKWTDVFRLVPNRAVTVGRATTNQIVVKDERCSRNHAEIFCQGDRWILRDLDSRNGTFIGARPVHGDIVLNPGDVIRIAHCQLAFVHDLAHAFPETGPVHNSTLKTLAKAETETSIEPPTFDSTSSSSSNISAENTENEQITHRKGQTRFLSPRSNSIAVRHEPSQADGALFRLAFELAGHTDVRSVAETALQGLFETGKYDAGALLIAPREHLGPIGPLDLQLVYSRSDIQRSYHRVSPFVAETVLRDGEAVLARNMEEDNMLAGRDSKGEIFTTSVLCAPIRQDRRVVGLMHLYSTTPAKEPDSDDLEFALAVAEIVALALKNLQRQQELAENLSLSQNELTLLRRRLGAESELIGSSRAMEQVHLQIARAAPSRATVLIRGESGVGKELVARAMHFQSPRKKGPFICLNCAALSETLLESELFGHERGAFTGATERKTGKFESAHMGTLMLDEIGEMSPSIQAKFLRVLEGHPFERVGGNQPIKVDVRVVAATNRDLESAVMEGSFRRDLYFRLHVVDIYVPPLRKRPEDVEELSRHFLAKFNEETGRKIRGFTQSATDALRSYRWPGNVRELKNVIERAVLLARGELIEPDDLSLTGITVPGETPDDTVAMRPRMPEREKPFEFLSMDQIEHKHILATLQATRWNKSKTASILGVERSTLDRKIKRYNISTPHSQRYENAPSASSEEPETPSSDASMTRIVPAAELPPEVD